MKTALITGATSYLGHALARRLMAEGMSVHALVRPDSDLARFDTLPQRPTVHVHDGDEGSLAASVERAAPEVVFHLASLYLREHTPERIEPLIQSNVLFGAQLLDALRRAGVSRFVNTGTYFQHFDSDRYRPLNLYAATKQAFEDILAYYTDAAGIEAVTLTLFDIYGPGDRRGKLMAAIREAQRTGEPLPLPTEDVTLDLVYVDDAVAAFVRAAELLETRPRDVAGCRFAVSSGRRHTIRETIAVFEEVGGRPVPQAWGKFPVAARQIAVPWLGAALPGWRAEVSLREGVRRFIAGE